MTHSDLLLSFVGPFGGFLGLLALRETHLSPEREGEGCSKSFDCFRSFAKPNQMNQSLITSK